MSIKIKDSHPKFEPLDFSGSLAKTVFNSLSANIAIIDEKGIILETNQVWLWVTLLVTASPRPC